MECLHYESLQFFHELTVSMSANPILGVVVGTVFTMIVQSSRQQSVFYKDYLLKVRYR